MKTIKLNYFFPIFVTFLLTLSSIHSASALVLNATPWQMHADGEWVSLVRVMDHHGHVDLHASAGDSVAEPWWAYNTSAIRIHLAKPQPVVVTAKTLRPHFQFKRIILPSPQKLYPQQLVCYALAVGPYLVNLGWGWLGDATVVKQYQLYRKALNQPNPEPIKYTGWKKYWYAVKGYFDNSSAAKSFTPEFKLIATFPAQAKNFHDSTVEPNISYEYRLVMIRNDGSKKIVGQKVVTPAPLKNSTLSVLAGKGIILLFDTNPGSAFYYKKLNPQKVIQQTKLMGLHYVELRTVYGFFSQFINKDLIKWLDQFLDNAAANNIQVISWSIPRRATSVSLASDVAIASHVSPSGNTFAGIALDLELGAGYIPTPEGKQRIATYATLLRKAVGKNYLVAAMVYSPWKSGYTNRDYPYRELAQQADVLQPMEFWHYYYFSAHHFYSKAEVTNAIKQAILLTQKYAEKKIPINVIGQLTDLGGTGKPSAFELTTALQAAKSYGALGLSFFDWYSRLFMENQIPGAQAGAIQRFPW